MLRKDQEIKKGRVDSENNTERERSHRQTVVSEIPTVSVDNAHCSSRAEKQGSHTTKKKSRESQCQGLASVQELINQSHLLYLGLLCVHCRVPIPRYELLPFNRLVVFIEKVVKIFFVLL